MKSIIAAIVFAIIAGLSLWQAVKMGAEVVETKRQFTEFKTAKAKEIADLKANHKAEIDNLNKKHAAENDIQADLSQVLSKLSALGITVNGKLSEILNKPVYSLRCSDSDGVREINKYAGKTPAEISNR